MADFELRPLLDDTCDAPPAGVSGDEHVVTCAAELFLRNGIESVKVAQIAQAAGVGVATVYRHFSTKAHIAVMAATLLWRRFNQQIRLVVDSEEFAALDGLNRLRVLLEGYCTAYVEQGDFVAFVDEFDHLVITDQLSRDDLMEYGAELDSFYPIFEAAYRLGREDGSIAREVEFRPFYLALAHALMGVAAKLRRGEIIPSDDFSSGAAELHCIVNMAMWSLVSSASVPDPAVAIDVRG